MQTVTSSMLLMKPDITKGWRSQLLKYMRQRARNLPKGEHILKLITHNRKLEFSIQYGPIFGNKN